MSESKIISKQSAVIVKLQVEIRKLQDTIYHLRSRLLKYRQWEIDVKEKMKGILETQKETNEILEERRKSKKIVCPECGIKIKIGEWYNKEKINAILEIQKRTTELEEHRKSKRLKDEE